MTHKFSDFRWASPQALKNPTGPTPLFCRAQLDRLKQWINDPESRVWVPVNPDGEIIGDESVGIVRVLRSLDVAAVVTWVAHVENERDADYFRGTGFPIPHGYAAQVAGARVGRQGRAIGAAQDPLTPPWWIDEAPAPFGGGPTVLRWSDVFSS
jgi:hypothetical protein